MQKNSRFFWATFVSLVIIAGLYGFYHGLTPAAPAHHQLERIFANLQTTICAIVLLDFALFIFACWLNDGDDNGKPATDNNSSKSEKPLFHTGKFIEVMGPDGKLVKLPTIQALRIGKEYLLIRHVQVSSEDHSALILLAPGEGKKPVLYWFSSFQAAAVEPIIQASEKHLRKYTTQHGGQAQFERIVVEKNPHPAFEGDRVLTPRVPRTSTAVQVLRGPDEADRQRMVRANAERDAKWQADQKQKEIEAAKAKLRELTDGKDDVVLA